MKIGIPKDGRFGDFGGKYIPETLAPAIKESGLYTIAEIILGLPGESAKDHLESIHKLVSAGLEDIVIHTCMLLPGSEMATPTEREKYKFQTKFRILPRDFATLKNGKRVCEIEEVVVGSKDMSFNDYVELRLMGFVLWMTNKGVLYDPVLKFLKQNKEYLILINYLELIWWMKMHCLHRINLNRKNKKK